jgi:2-dehydro-3-deoxyphosphogluconate aldolase/(4S)-4-hydroxy-2-oxoglutarate aldolase
MLGLEFIHMGITSDCAEEGKRAAKLFETLFGLTLKETSKSVFAGDAFEFMLGKGPGTHGHIAIRTNFVDRAMAYFKRMGIEFDESSVTYDEKTGKPKFAYFKDEICGFAIHLVTKK